MKLRYSFFPDAESEPRIHWSTQNLNGEWYPVPKLMGSILRHGRAHLWLRRSGSSDSACIGLEWSFLHRPNFLHAYIAMEPDWEDQIRMAFAVPGAAVWLTLDWKVLRRVVPKLAGQCGIEVHNGGIWLSVWASPNAWSRSAPWWRNTHNFFPLDWLLGKYRYSQQTITETWEPLQLPEGVVMVKVQLYEASWRRPRWPFARRLLRADITPAEPIPIPGTWDRDDAMYDFCTPAQTVPAALEALRAAVLRNRAKQPSWTVPERVSV